MHQTSEARRGGLGWIAAGLLAGCGSDPESPFAPIESVIAAAREGDAAGLSELCDPEGYADADARRVCAARPEAARDWAMFRAWFGEARILGLADATGQSPDEVRVAVAMGPDLRHVEVTVVKRGARWFLLRL